MLISCKNCNKIYGRWQEDIPELKLTTDHPKDWIVEGYCPECSKEHLILCENCNTPFYNFKNYPYEEYGVAKVCYICRRSKT